MKIDPVRVPRLGYVPAALCSKAENPEDAKKFLEFLHSAEGQEIFSRHGYIATEKEARVFAPNALIGGKYQLPKKFRGDIE